MGAVRFQAVVDVQALQGIMQALHEVTGIAHALVDAEGRILYQLGWQDACHLFHRSEAVTALQCQQSNQELIAASVPDTFVGQCCRNGLMDFAVPVALEGMPLASVVVGQLLHDPPNLAFFRAQAKHFGFDESLYLAAIQRVPIVPKAKVEALLACYVRLIQTLAEKGLALHKGRVLKQQLAQANAVLEEQVAQQTQILAEQNRQLEEKIAVCTQTEQVLRIQQDSLQALLDASPVAIACSSGGNVEYLNHRFTELLGYELSDVPRLEDWYRLAYPDAHVRRTQIDPWRAQIDRAHQSSGELPELESSVVCKNGETRRVIVRVSWVGEKRLASVTDITARWLSLRREKSREQILESIAKGLPLKGILERIILSFEAENPTSLGSVLLLDAEGQHLHLGAAPHVPDFFNQAIDGLAIGAAVGSCGSAAFLQQRVIVEDITRDVRWQHYRPLAKQAGLAACWSEPFFSSDGRLLGTFAIYHPTPCRPTQEDLLRITQAANLATIAVEHDQTRRELEFQARTDFLTGLANRRYFVTRAEHALARSHRHQTPLSLLMLDIDFFKAVNDRFGHKAGDVVLQQLSNTLQGLLREVDVVGRIGGEEFAVLLPETSSKHALEVAERVRLAIGRHVIQVGESVFQVTVSIGVAHADPESASPVDVDVLLRRADAALYQAKQQGRNCVCVDSEQI